MKKYATILFILIITGITFTQINPLEILKSKDIELQSAIDSHKRSPVNHNRQKLIATINGIFDFTMMSQKVLPKATWDGTDSIQKAKFTEAFQRMIENSSITKLDIYQSDSIHYDSLSTKNSTASVSAHLWYKGKQTVLVYKMALIGKQWKVYDLIINDLSTLRNYREQFISILQKKSLEELIQILEKKADSYNKSK